MYRTDRVEADPDRSSSAPWLAERGCELPDMSRQTIEAKLAGDSGSDRLNIRRILELRVAGARGSTQKFQSLLKHSTPELPRITHHTQIRRR